MLTYIILLKHFMTLLTKKKHLSYDAYKHKNVIWDKGITHLRVFQSAFTECMRGFLTSNQFSRWMSLMVNPYLSVSYMTRQFLDVLNIEYLNMTKEKRTKNISSISKRIANFYHDVEHDDIKLGVSQAAKKHGCAEAEIRISGYEYPDDIEW